MTIEPDSTTSKWSSKIRGLLAHAQDPSNPPETRQMFFAKAAELMERYGIDQAQLRAEGGDHTPEQAQVWSYAVAGGQGLGNARAEAACHIAMAMRCKTVMQTAQPPRPCMVIVAGVDSDIAAVRTLLPLVMRQAELAAALAAAGGNRAPSYLGAFLVGFALEVAGRIRARRRDWSPGTGAELILASRERIVADLYAEVFGDVPTASSKYQRADGNAAGRAAGRQADLGDSQLGNSEPPALPGPRPAH
jgi:hypothetical protein